MNPQSLFELLPLSGTELAPPGYIPKSSSETLFYEMDNEIWR